MDAVHTDNSAASAEHTVPQYFWEGTRGATIAIALLFLLVQSITWTIPPFQSADEFNHLKRAYLLSKGDIFLRAEAGRTGGDIDTGLLEYIDYFYPIHDHKGRIANPGYARSAEITWSGRREFSALPNTAGYFPLPYAPQAMAFAIGENSGMSVRVTYYLVRTASLAATLALLWLALRLHPVPPSVVILLILPMTLYQFGSASLDAISIAACVLTACLFMRGAHKGRSFLTYMHLALVLCLFMLATSRSYFIALTLLPLVLYSVRKSRAFLLSTFALITLSVGWLVYVFKTVKGMTGGEGVAAAATKYYLTHLGTMMDVLITTFTSPAIVGKYWKEFVGVFGAVDAPMNSFVYVWFSLLLVAVAVMSFELDKRVSCSTANLAITVAAIISTAMLVLIMLVVATPVGLQSIVGMYGRYFIPVAVFLGFSMFGRRLPPPSRKAALVLIFLGASTSVGSIAPAMLSRYWISTGAADAREPTPTTSPYSRATYAEK